MKILSLCIFKNKGPALFSIERQHQSTQNSLLHHSLLLLFSSRRFSFGVSEFYYTCPSLQKIMTTTTNQV